MRKLYKIIEILEISEIYIKILKNYMKYSEKFSPG